jgi:sugar transferase (PEP-CTERM/EpsH1 system associated)
MHLAYALGVGGLETLLVDCINKMPSDQYRHVVVCLTRSSSFAQRITQADVEVYELNKAPGLGLGTHVDFWKLARRLRPTVLHTYNLAAMEYAFTAALAGVPVRVHAEHGRDTSDPQGLNPKHNFLRRRLAAFIDCYVPVSEDLNQWLGQVVRIPAAKTLFIKNGVDTDKYQPAPRDSDGSRAPWGREHFVIGTVARVSDIKNHRGLVDAFIRLRALLPEQAPNLRLSIIGDGPLLPALREQVAAAGLTDVVWLPGARSDVAQLVAEFSVFALPSLAEGTPVSLLEAMACALPVVASNVGGIPEVVTEQVEGSLVPPQDVEALAQALARYAASPSLVSEHGRAGRARIVQQYSMAAMITAYTGLYARLGRQKRVAAFR